MKIAPELIDAAQKAGEPDDILHWLRERPRTVAELVKVRPDWALRLAGRVPEAVDLLTAEQIDACAVADPWAALRHTAGRLSPPRLDACAAADPWTALERAAHLLTPERLDACAEAAPDAALQYAADLLSPERQAWCRRQVRTP